MCHCFSGQIERQAAPGEDGNHQNWTSSLRYHQHLGPIIVFIQTAPRRRAPFLAPLLQRSPHSFLHLHLLRKVPVPVTFIEKQSKASLLSQCLCTTVCVFFCFASVTGQVPAELCLRTAPTSSSPDFRETVIVSAPALKGSAGCSQPAQPFHIFSLSPQVSETPLHFRIYFFPSMNIYLSINVWQHSEFSRNLMINTYKTALMH